MKIARTVTWARTLIAIVVSSGLAGQAGLVAQAPASAPASAPAGGVPTNLITAEPPFPVVLHTKDKPPLAPKMEDLPLRQSVYRYGITWTFEKPARVGRFVNGDWYVVGPVTVTLIAPKPLYGDEVKDPEPREAKYKGKYCRNGSVLNLPVESFPSGFDSRVPHNRYKPELSAHLPIAMKPGDALVSSISLAKGGDYPMRSYSVLTCLKEPVPEDAFRPGYCDREQAIYLARNLRRDLLPRLLLPPPPTQEDVAELRIKTYPPKIKDSEDIFCRTWIDLNFFEGDQAQYQMGGYGRAIAEWGGRATLLLTLDFPAEEKERLLRYYIQYGLDLWGLVKNGFSGWVAHGGWGSGRKLPIVFAGLMLGEEKLAHVNRSFPKANFQEDTQTMHDDCWTGAGAVYYGHVGTRSLKEADTPTGWGPYEHLHPSRWADSIGRNYRSDMTSSTWVAEALAIRILQAEKQWNYDAFLDYCDRWMTEPDLGYGTCGAAFSYQGAKNAAKVPRAAAEAVSPSYCFMDLSRSDTPELKGIPGSLLQVQPAYQWMKKMDASRPVFLTVGEVLLKDAAEGRKDLYQSYLDRCQVIGCAVYPVTRENSPARLDEVARSVGALVELASGKPVYAWIETRIPVAPAPRGRPATDPAATPGLLKPAYVRAEVWMAIIRGATGIGYRGFESPKADVRPHAEMMAELKKVNAKIAVLAPALLAAPAKAKVEMTLAGDLACHWRATELDGATYVFAQSIDLGAEKDQLGPGKDITPRGGKATIKVAGLKAGTKIEVVDENRTLTAEEGQFTDEFSPLAEHVYRIAGK